MYVSVATNFYWNGTIAFKTVYSLGKQMYCKDTGCESNIAESCVGLQENREDILRKLCVL